MVQVGDTVHSSEYGKGKVVEHIRFESVVDFELSGRVVNLPDSDLIVLSRRRAPVRKQSDRLLELLTLVKAEGYTRTKLMELGFGNPNAVVMGLRKRGFKINTIPMVEGSCRYVLEN